jgi:hypothetical protein
MSRSLLPNVGGGKKEADEGGFTCEQRPRSYYSVWDRVRLGFRAQIRGGGGSRNVARERDVEAGETQGTTKDGKGPMNGLTGLTGFAGRIKRQKGSVVAAASQFDTLVGEDDGIRPMKDKAGTREEVRQVTSSPVPRNPPIAYHYPVRVHAGCYLVKLNAD